MKHQIVPFTARVGFSLIVFSFLFGATVVLASGLSLSFIGPNLAGISNVLLPLIIATPLAYLLLLVLAPIKRLGCVRYALPVLVFPILFGTAFAVTMNERNPKNMFQVFVVNPIPEGISNIRAQDITMGIDLDIVMAFEATPEALDEIITKNELHWAGGHSFDQDKSPDEYFPEVNWNKNWSLYKKCETDKYCMWLWVAPDRSAALYRYWEL